MNGEVLLFRTKKSRYRAIPMMGSMDGRPTQSKYTFESSLTFKVSVTSAHDVMWKQLKHIKYC